MNTNTVCNFEQKFGVRSNTLLIVSDGDTKNLLNVYTIKPFAQATPLDKLPPYMNFAGRVFLYPSLNGFKIKIEGFNSGIKEESKKEQLKNIIIQEIQKYLRFQNYSHSPQVLSA